MNAKKLIALVCAFAMLFSFAGTAFAADGPAKTDISITKFDPVNEIVEFSGKADGDKVSVDFDQVKMELPYYKAVGIQTEVTEAVVCEYPYNAEAAKVYNEYSVDYDKENSAVVIKMTGLKPHKNAKNEVGFWTGFAVKAPEGAAKFTYWLSNGGHSETPIAVETIDATGTKGIAFYFDAQNPAEYVEFQWYDADDKAISKLESAEIDASNVELIEAKGEVSEAIISAKENAEKVVYNKYDVKSNKNTDTVEITMTDLKPHKNAHDVVGFWTGFAVEVPNEKAKGFEYSIIAPIYDSGNERYNYNYISGGRYSELEDIATDKKGVAFYLDAEDYYYDESKEKVLAYVNLQWLDADGNPLAARTTYTVDLTKVDLYAIDESMLITEAVVRDDKAPSVPAYNTYSVDYNKKTRTVEIEMTGLKLHQNANDEIGYWTGFAVKAPVGADSFNYWIDKGGNGDDVALETIDADGTKGVAFYFNTAECYDYKTDETRARVMLEWLGEDGVPLADSSYYTVDLNAVSFATLADKGIGKANVADYDDSTAVVYDKYEVTPCDNGSVKITMDGLKKHTSGKIDEATGDYVEGYWTGFSVKAPEGATHYEYAFYGWEGEYSESEGFIALDGDDEVSFFIDAGSLQSKDEVWIAWYTDDETPYTCLDSWYYPVDITDVKFAGVDKSSVAAATIACTEDVDKVLYADGTYDATEANGTIKIKATDLKTHVNAEGDRGAWVGVEFTAPAGAEYAKYVFAADKASALNDWIGYYNYDIDDYYIDWKIVDADEASFYVNAFEPKDEIKDVIMLQWFDNEDYAVSNVETYTLDLSGVDYKVNNEVEMEVTAAPIVDQDNPEVVPYFGEPTASLKKNAITLTSGYIFSHASDNAGNGAWIGFVGTVEGAKYARYAFYNSEYDYISWHDAEEISVEDKESFYVNASAYNMKDTLSVQWFDENGDALTNVNTYTIAVDTKYGYERTFDVLFSNIKLTGEDAEKYNLVYNGGWPNLEDTEYVGEVSTRDYIYVAANTDGYGTVEYDGDRYNVFERDTDYTDGIDAVKLTAVPGTGYKFVGWYYAGEQVSTSNSYKVDRDTCYDNLYAVFEKGTSSKPAGNGGGGLAAGGDKSNAGADDLGQKDEDKTEGTIVPSAPSFFVDVPAGAWYYSVVKEAYDKGLMNGVSATTFAPSQSLTRGMFVTILYRLAGSPEVTAASSFADVPANQYYADAVAWASANSIVNGVSADKFAPNNNITREQMAAIIHRYAVANNIEAAGNSEVTYSDSAKISEFAKAAVEWATNAGVLSGNSDGTFAPLRTATRAEAAAIFVRLLGLVK